jgi:fructose-bisphosphate aldolase class I
VVRLPAPAVGRSGAGASRAGQGLAGAPGGRVTEGLDGALRGQGVVLERLLLKPNMVGPGVRHPHQASVDAAAEATVRCLCRAVPATVPGIVFLSGGQAAREATAHLNAMNAMRGTRPWRLSFSFAQALQGPAIGAWRGEPARAPAAQEALHHRAV